MSTRRLDWPLNPYYTRGLTPGQIDSGVVEPINLLAPPAYYPTFTSNAEVNNPSSDAPQAYDVRGCRALEIQLDSWNVTTAGAFQVQASINGSNYAPLYIIPAGGSAPGATTLAIPTGGTAQNAAIATIVTFDAPWFNYIRILITTPVLGTGAAGTLTISKRA